MSARATGAQQVWLLALQRTEPRNTSVGPSLLSVLPKRSSHPLPLHPTMFVAASEDLDDLFDIVQRVGARAAESSPGSPNDISEEGKDDSMEVDDADDTEVDLIPTTVLEVQPKKERKVSKVRMNHCFRVDSIIKPTRRHCNDSPRVCDSYELVNLLDRLLCCDEMFCNVQMFQGVHS